MFNQAKDLVARLRNDNLEYDWKLVTVFIGGNDLCDYCSDVRLHDTIELIFFLMITLHLTQYCRITGFLLKAMWPT